jgi:hypothetical protein
MTRPCPDTTPDRRIAIDTRELLEWARLTAQLAEWLTCPASSVKADHQQRFPLGPTLPQHAWTLHNINERIHTLINHDQDPPPPGTRPSNPLRSTETNNNQPLKISP